MEIPELAAPELMEVRDFPEPVVLLIGSRCGACGTVCFPRRHACPRCSTPDPERALLGPCGTLHSYTRVQDPADPARGFMPVVQVQLDEGPVVRARVAEPSSADLRLGAPVILVPYLLPASGDLPPAITFAARVEGGCHG